MDYRFSQENATIPLACIESTGKHFLGMKSTNAAIDRQTYALKNVILPPIKTLVRAPYSDQATNPAFGETLYILVKLSIDEIRTASHLPRYDISRNGSIPVADLGGSRNHQGIS